jgi:hypothetical protein
MKKTLTLLILLLTINFTNAQTFDKLLIKLNSFKTFEEYDKVDKEILNACDYILSKPLERKNKTREYYFALKSMVKWMSHTESYRILIFGKVIEASHNDPLMQNMFMASMGKYLLEQRYIHNRHLYPEKRPDIKFQDLPGVKETLLESSKIFFSYLKTTSEIRPNRELRKGIKAFENSELEKYMFEKK